LVKLKLQSGRLFQHPHAAILNYHFAQTTLFFHISNTKKEELEIKNVSHVTCFNFGTAAGAVKA